MHQIKMITHSADTEIVVGELLTHRLRALKPAPILLVDENVLREHHEIFNEYSCIKVPSGEQYKTLFTIERIHKELINLEVDRSSFLVGVGGGLATDVAGFVASTYLRGLQFGLISTTLLGQVDASIGGKNGVNMDGFKNMIGTIRQPSFVWCDLSLLSTLAHKEYISGIAEVIKYGAIYDADFLQYLTGNMAELLSQDMGVLDKVVARSATIKVDVVQKDENESNVRRILNFGHTIGHAIERDKKVLHGEAVATGMVLASRLSQSMGLLAGSDVDLIQDLLISAGLPVSMELDADILFQNIRKDKKKSGDSINFVLLDGLGNAMVKTIPLTELKMILHDLC